VIKLIGSGLILAGGGWLWWLKMAERRRKREVLWELICSLRRMGEEISLTRIRLPELLERLGENCRTQDAAQFFRAVSAAVSREESIKKAWQRATEALPAAKESKVVLAELAEQLHGKECNICQAISLVIDRLERQLREWDFAAPEATRRTTALCFSGAALLVILLL